MPISIYYSFIIVFIYSSPVVCFAGTSRECNPSQLNNMNTFSNIEAAVQTVFVTNNVLVSTIANALYFSIQCQLNLPMNSLFC